MRHLFVASCLGLLTLGSAVDPELSYSKLTDDGEQAVVLLPNFQKAEIAVAPAMRADKQANTAALLVSTGYADQYEIPDPVSERVPAYLRLLKPIVKPIIARSRAEICDSLTDAAQSNNLPLPFFIRLLYQESGFRPGTVSPAGAEGIAQFMRETAADVGLDNPYDPVQAIAASARLLRDLAQKFGNLGLAAAAYNAGPKRIRDWLVKTRNLPAETQDYVTTITGRPVENWTLAAAGSPAVKLQRHAPCQETAGLLAWDGPEHIPLPPMRGDKTRKAPMEPTPALRGTAMAVLSAHVKIARHGTQMAAVTDPVTLKVSAKGGVKQDTKHAIAHAAATTAIRADFKARQTQAMSAHVQ